MTTVRIKHVRQAKLCASGTRVWFQRHGIDYTDFLKNGIDAEKILTLGDHFGNTVVALAQKEEEEQRLKEAING